MGPGARGGPEWPHTFPVPARKALSPIPCWTGGDADMFGVFWGRTHLDGHVVGIAENTTPESLEIIQSGKPVLGVLEVRAGTAARLGITKGSLVMHPMFAATPEAGKAQDK